MTNRFMQAVLAGVVAAAIMSVVEMIAPYMRLPKMNMAEMLSGMLGVSLVLGWIMHFMIGIIFAATYVFWFNPAVKIHSKFWKGLLFGFVVFVFAEIMMWLMGKMLPMPMMGGNKMLTMLGSLIGHFVYGLVVALIIPFQYAASTKSDRFAAAN